MALELYDDTDAVEPLDLDLVKLQVKLPTGDAAYAENGLIEEVLIPAVRQRCEAATRRQLREVTYELKLDGFPSEPFIELPRPPLLDVEAVTYVDTGGTVRTLTVTTDYLVSAPAGEKPRRGRIALPAGKVWPTPIGQMNCVTIRFRCGHNADATLNHVPPILKAAMLLDAATLYADRENLIKGVWVAELPGGRRGIYWQWQSHPTQVLPGCEA